MKKTLAERMVTRLRICIAALLLVILSLFLFSFTLKKVNEEFMKQLGISQATADDKITGSLLSGSLDYYGISNLKHILFNNRAAVVKDVAAYAKNYVNSNAFRKKYNQLRENNKPAPAQQPEPPEEIRASMIKMAREFVQSSEENLKKAGPDMKKIFEQSLETAKKNLKDAEDPYNKSLKAYGQNYESMKTMMQRSYDNSIKIWETKYPADHLQYIKVKLQAFLEATAGIDFNAQLVEKNGKKYFANPDYERKGNRWKLAFRAGRDAVEAGRAFAGQWISEIK